MGSQKEQCFLAVALSIAMLTVFAGCAPSANESSSIAALGSPSTASASASSSDVRGTLAIEGGMAQPMLAWSDHRADDRTRISRARQVRKRMHRGVCCAASVVKLLNLV